jgi:hypothetical protein
MKNFNEPHRNEELTTADIAGKDRMERERMERDRVERMKPRESEVIPFERKAVSSNEAVPLLAKEETEELRNRWSTIQAGFVDEPRNAVQEADKLVARAVQRLAEVFADERSKMEHQWSRGDQVSTEDLRVCLQRYRSFFTRLLSV